MCAETSKKQQQEGKGPQIATETHILYGVPGGEAVLPPGQRELHRCNPWGERAPRLTCVRVLGSGSKRRLREIPGPGEAAWS